MQTYRKDTLIYTYKEELLPEEIEALLSSIQLLAV